MSDALIRAENITITKGHHKVLDDVSIEVKLGEIVTLIGPNGAGKSTLVRALLGLGAPDSGTVRQSDTLTVGYVPQKVALDKAMPLSVDRLLRVNTLVSAEERRAALSDVGLSGLDARSVHALSGGELQRALLARALIRRPNLLVLDEPTQNVDVGGAADLYQLVSHIRSTTGCGVLVVSHDLHVVMAETDHVYCLHHHMCCSGKPEAIRTDPAFKELFGPAAHEALALYTHSHDHHHDPSGHVVDTPEPGHG